MRIVVALALAVALVAPAGAQSRRNARPASEQPRPPVEAEAPPVARLPEDLPQLFPKETTIYVELVDVARALESSGADMLFRQFMTEIMSSPTQRESIGKLFQSPQLKPVLASTLAFGSFPRPRPKGAVASAKGVPATSEAGVLRMRTPAALGKALPVILASLQPNLVNAKPMATVKIGEVAVEIVAADTKPTSPAYAVVGRDLIAGDVASVTTLLGNAAQTREQSLAGRSDFTAAVNRMGERRAAFGWFLIPKWSVDLSSAAERGMPPEQLEEYRSWVEQTERVYGYSALKSFSFSVRANGDGLTVQGMVDMDVERAGLLPTLLKMPPASLRAADFVPQGAELFWSAGVDLGKVYALLADPEGAPDTFSHTFGIPGRGHVHEIERTMLSAYGISVPHDVVGAFGDTVAMAKGTAPHEPGSEKAPERFVIAVVEVRRPDALRNLVQKYNDLFGEVSPERAVRSEYRGAEVWTFGDRSWAMIDGFGIGGGTKSVERALDAHASGATLATSAAFADTARSAPRELGGVFFATSREIVSEIVGASRLPGGEQFERLLSSAGVSGFATREPGGAFFEIHLRSSVLSALATPAGALRKDLNEPVAIGNLRTIGSAEATFYANQGRYGTMQELVEAQMLDPEWMDQPVRDGYRLELSVTVVGSQAEKFTATAVPDRYGETGKRSFIILEDFVIRAADRNGEAPLPDDPPIGGDSVEEEEIDWDYESPSAKSLVPILGVLVALGNPRSRQSFALEALSVLYEAQQAYVQSHGRLGSVDDLKESGVLDKGFTGFPERNGYRFAFRSIGGSRGESFAVTATPTTYVQGLHSFYASPDTGLRGADKGGAEAGPDDPRMSEYGTAPVGVVEDGDEDF